MIEKKEQILKVEYYIKSFDFGNLKTVNGGTKIIIIINVLKNFSYIALDHSDDKNNTDCELHLKELLNSYKNIEIKCEWKSSYNDGFCTNDFYETRIYSSILELRKLEEIMKIIIAYINNNNLYKLFGITWS